MIKVAERPILIKEGIELKTYIGHIRNWEQLCIELNIDCTLSREQREKEILLQGYRLWKENLPNHLYGMFAFALWDEKAQRLFCARDHFGTKPFYYYLTEDNRLLYATMIRDLMTDPAFKKELNQDLLQIYLTMTYIPGSETMFKGVKKLMPGHYLTFEQGKLDIVCYWEPQYQPNKEKTLEEFADEIHQTLGKIMKEIKDPNEYVESFLSGGVDSSYVFAMSDAKVGDSCGYDEARFDESILAKKTADLLGKENRRTRITPEAFFAIVPEVMYQMEQPLADASAIVFALGCQAAAKYTSIVYSGEGADEFFGGYNIYRQADRYASNLETFYVGNTNIMKEEEKKEILKFYRSDLLPIDFAKPIYAGMKNADPLTKMTNVDIHLWLDGDIYLNVDKMSRAAGIEVRMPLTDRRIFNIASQLPNDYKINEKENKIALRLAASKVLPEEVAYRKKLGFIVPIRIWMADPRYNQDVLAKFKSPIAEQFFHLDRIQAILDRYLSKDSDLWRQVWTIYTFLVWYEEYFVKR